MMETVVQTHSTTADAGRESSSIAPSGVLGDIELQAAIELGRTSMKISALLQLAPGSVVALNTALGEPVELTIDGRPIARGDIVAIDDRFAIHVTEVLTRSAVSAA